MTPELERKLVSRAPGRAVRSALALLLRADRHLLEVDANERSITHRLGIYLQAELPKYDVDCEYNRNAIDAKEIDYVDLHPAEDDDDGQTVFPDLIVHMRGTSNNYLVIECKKSSSNVDRRTDIAKLRAYRRDDRLGYKYALFIEFRVGSNPGISRVEWVDA